MFIPDTLLNMIIYMITTSHCSCSVVERVSTNFSDNPRKNHSNSVKTYSKYACDVSILFSIYSNIIFSDTALPTKAKFHVEPLWEGVGPNFIKMVLVT